MSHKGVMGGRLKLKKNSGVAKVKKVSKPNPKPDTETQASSGSGADANSAETEPKVSTQKFEKVGKTLMAIKTPPNTTKAEMAFKKRQRELQMQRVMAKATKSHREKVEEFNMKIGNQSDFNDVPKISWTK